MKALKKIAIDIVPVLAGVIIALFINNWNEDRNDARFIDQTLAALQLEIAASKADADEIVPKHLLLYDSLQQHLEDDSLSILQMIQITSGIQYFTIENAAWQALLNGNIQLVDHPTFARLNQIDVFKGSLQRHVERLNNFVMNNVTETSKESKMKLMLHIHNLIDTEQRVQELMDAHVKAHKS